MRNESLYQCMMQSLLQAALRFQRSSKAEKKLSGATNILIELPLLTLSKTITNNFLEQTDSILKQKFAKTHISSFSRRKH